MNDRGQTRWIVTVLAGAVLSIGVADAEDAQTVAEQVAGMQQMCADTEAARTQRQENETLYNRLGGYDRIHEFTRELVRLHNENTAIQHMFNHLDSETLAKHVADFVASGTGGPESYTGRDMPTAHADLDLTDADFLTAGADIVQAMQTMGYGQDEIDEFVCILVSLKDQVIF